MITVSGLDGWLVFILSGNFYVLNWKRAENAIFIFHVVHFLTQKYLDDCTIYYVSQAEQEKTQFSGIGSGTITCERRGFLKFLALYTVNFFIKVYIWRTWRLFTEQRLKLHMDQAYCQWLVLCNVVTIMQKKIVFNVCCTVSAKMTHVVTHFLLTYLILVLSPAMCCVTTLEVPRIEDITSIFHIVKEFRRVLDNTTLIQCRYFST